VAKLCHGRPPHVAKLCHGRPPHMAKLFFPPPPMARLCRGRQPHVAKTSAPAVPRGDAAAWQSVAMAARRTCQNATTSIRRLTLVPGSHPGLEQRYLQTWSHSEEPQQRSLSLSLLFRLLLLPGTLLAPMDTVAGSLNIPRRTRKVALSRSRNNYAHSLYCLRGGLRCSPL